MTIWLLTTDVYFYTICKVLCEYFEQVEQAVTRHVYFFLFIFFSNIQSSVPFKEEIFYNQGNWNLICCTIF